MNRVISKLFFLTHCIKNVSFRTIFTKEYLGLAFLQGKQNESQAKAGRNAVKIKDNFLKSYKQRGIKDLRRNDIMNYMHLVEGEKALSDLAPIPTISSQKTPFPLPVFAKK